MQPDGWVVGSGGILLWIAICVWVSISEKDWKPVGLFAVLPLFIGILMKGLV